MKNLNNRQRLALHVLEWHGGQSSSSYSLGSTWLNNERVSYKVGISCLDEFKSLLPSSDLNKTEKKDLNDIIRKVESQVYKDQGADIITVSQLRKALRCLKGNMPVLLVIQGSSEIPISKVGLSSDKDFFMIAPDEDSFYDEFDV